MDINTPQFTVSMKKIQRNMYVAIIILTVSIGWLYLTETGKLQSITEELSITEARTTVRKDLSFRQWIASYKRVYVPESSVISSDPPMLDSLDPVIQSPSGENLILITPEFALRHYSEKYLKTGGVISHLTSLKPIRPENEADQWEASALQRLEAGESEVYEISMIDGEEYLRLMIPLIVEESCLSCHGKQGYKIGDIRGGISASVPMKEYRVYEDEVMFLHSRNYGILWVTGVIGIVFGSRRISKDMEELAKAERLKEYNLQLKRLDELKSQFISTATHDLRTPLTSIKGYVELLRSGIAEPGSKEFWGFVDTIERNVDRATHLTSDLLDVERLGSGKVHLDLKKLNWKELVDNAKEEMAPLFLKKNQRLIVKSSVEDIVFNVDDMRISQVFINLLNNASKFSPDGSNILLNVILVEDMLRFCVSDTGIGLSEEDISKLFKPFPSIRVQGNYQQTGLGLSICKGIVDLHGGEIWVESEGRGHGSTFCFTLPVKS